MPITINGAGTISGLSAGGLPDATVTPDDLSQAYLTEIADGSVTEAKLDSSIDFSEMVLISEGTATSVAYVDMPIDASLYEHYVCYVRSWASADGATPYLDYVYSGGTYAGWYGGYHAVGEANSGSSAAFSNEAYCQPFFGKTTTYISNTYTTSGIIWADLSFRGKIQWHLTGRFSGGSTQCSKGGALSTTGGLTANAPTAFRLSQNITTDSLSYKWFGIKI